MFWHIDADLYNAEELSVNIKKMLLKVKDNKKHISDSDLFLAQRALHHMYGTFAFLRNEPNLLFPVVIWFFKITFGARFNPMRISHITSQKFLYRFELPGPASLKASQKV